MGTRKNLRDRKVLNCFFTIRNYLSLPIVKAVVNLCIVKRDKLKNSKLKNKLT